MKQHITIDQLNELSEQGKEKLREWWKPQVGHMVLWDHLSGPLTRNGECMWDDLTKDDFEKDDYLPLLSIGQMIEFLNENSMRITRQDHEGAECWYIEHSKFDNNKIWMFIPELCDALWEAVKQVLEEK